MVSGYHTEHHRLRESLPIHHPNFGTSHELISSIFYFSFIYLLNKYWLNCYSPLFIIVLPSLSTSKVLPLMKFMFQLSPINHQILIRVPIETLFNFFPPWLCYFQYSLKIIKFTQQREIIQTFHFSFCSCYLFLILQKGNKSCFTTSCFGGMLDTLKLNIRIIGLAPRSYEMFKELFHDAPYFFFPIAEDLLTINVEIHSKFWVRHFTVHADMCLYIVYLCLYICMSM